MNSLPPPLLLLPLLLLLAATPAPSAAQSTATEQADASLSFRPSIAIVIGIFSVMFSLTFLLLVYAKFCRSVVDAVNENNQHALDRSTGLDKAVIDALPFFRFSALKGSKEGLECAVCLSRFEDAEMLRLLPKCKHAFHIACVDRWLEGNSSCPLCRCMVDETDATPFKCSISSRFLFRNLSNKIESDLELYVERGPAAEAQRSKDVEAMRAFEHRIVVPDSAFKNRWSDLGSAAGLATSVGCEMLPSGAKRCKSEITNVPRFVDASREDERVRKEWLPIARKTTECAAEPRPPLPEV